MPHRKAMNKKVNLQDLGTKDFKETWDYQEEIFKQIIDLKIKNRREETNLETPNYSVLRSRGKMKCIFRRNLIDHIMRY